MKPYSSYDKDLLTQLHGIHSGLRCLLLDAVAFGLQISLPDSQPEDDGAGDNVVARLRGTFFFRIGEGEWDERGGVFGEVHLEF
jgi:hypothetical protein